MLLRTAGNEISRRRTALPMGDLDADDLAQQVAKSALAAITANLGDHDGRTAFTIWASKYVVAEISAEIARLAWRTVSIPADQEHWARLPALAGLSADEQASWTRAVAALRRAVTEDLSEQQRAAFQAVVLGNIPIDVLAMELRSTRNAVYKALFEARRKLRNSLAADGLGLEPVTQQLLGEPPGLDRLLGVTQGDAGCDVTFQNLDGYVDAERRGLDPARNYAPVEAHLRSCDPCRQDYRGVLAASRGAVRAPAGGRPDRGPSRSAAPATAPTPTAFMALYRISARRHAVRTRRIPALRFRPGRLGRALGVAGRHDCDGQRNRDQVRRARRHRPAAAG